ncbi:MAG: transcriptional regulator [Microbacterium sp.]|nr:MAG: transcriptional regulator [Microbacterium sp.]
MAARGGRSAGGAKPPRGRGGPKSGGKPVAKRNATSRKPAAASGVGAGRTPTTRAASADAAPTPPSEATGPFRLGAIEGATPGKWIDAWKERMPGAPLELVPLELAGQRAALDTASVDAALVRLPFATAGLHVIPLYDEVPVVVCAADSHLAAADELTLADLAGEVVIVPHDPPLTVEVPGGIPPCFAPPATVADAVATVAAGVGVVIVPMSLARLHHRKDADYRPLADGPTSTVALAWRTDAGSPLIDAFVGIVRGRTANSSR